MKKLKAKVFYTIFVILTFSALVFVVTYNIEKYIENENTLKNNLKEVEKTGESIQNGSQDGFQPKADDNSKIKDEMPKNNSAENIKFVDTTVYTILLDEDNQIKDVINHSNNQVSDDEITNTANKILNKENIKSIYIGCLYLEDYSYSYLKGVSLTIIDNTSVKDSLQRTLELSMLIFLMLVFIFLLISKKITKWITSPVEEAFSKQKQFIADASHELKTPLSVIIASSEALSDEPDEKKWLKNIKVEANRMNSLIKNLLELAKTEDKQNIVLTKNNLSKVVELSVLTFEGIFYENKIKLKYDIEDNITFSMNEDSIRQLIEILLDNALKHSYPKETVYLSLNEEKNNIVLMVKNKGKSIPDNERDKIFDRFYRVDKSRNRRDNNYGLGLSIAKNIVTIHNGKISAFSKNEITTFKVLFKK